MAFDEYTNQDGPEISLPSYAAYTSEQFHIMTIDADGYAILADDADVAAEPMLGVLQNKPSAQGQPAVIRISGICKVMGGASLDEGTWVTTDGSGHAVACADYDQALGFCIDSMTSGRVSRILIDRIPHYLDPTT